MKIVLDIDGVIADFAKCLINEINETYNTKLIKNDLKTLMTNNILGINSSKCNEIEYKTFFNYNLEPIKGSISALSKLNESFEVYILTSRTNKMKAKTIEWLIKNNIKFKGIFFVPRKKKRKTIYRLKPTYWIEDDSDILINCPSYTRPILFSQPWNKYCLDITNKLVRLTTWSEIIKYILF